MSKTRRVKVKAPAFMTMHGRQPIWGCAWVDPGGTIFGPGPYLKLPCTGDNLDLVDTTTHRVFAPGGYEGRTVELELDDKGVWWWVITKKDAE